MTAVPKMLEPTRGKRGLTTIPSANGNIVNITMTDSTNAEMAVFGEEIYRELSSQKVPFAVILDIRTLNDYPAKQREIYVGVRQRVRGVYEKFHRLTVYVVESDKQRGFVTAVGWKAAASDTSGRTFVERWDEAYELCRRSLE